MIEFYKQNENSWIAWNKTNNKSAEVVKIFEYNAFSRSKQRYRVDAEGRTMNSLVENFQKAKGIAYTYVR